MQPDALRFFRFLAALLFLATLYAGYYMIKNYDKLFGPDPNMPSENSSARSYSRVQFIAIWAHVVVGSAIFAFFWD